MICRKYWHYLLSSQFAFKLFTESELNIYKQNTQNTVFFCFEQRVVFLNLWSGCVHNGRGGTGSWVNRASGAPVSPNPTFESIKTGVSLADRGDWPLLCWLSSPVRLVLGRACTPSTVLGFLYICLTLMWQFILQPSTDAWSGLPLFSLGNQDADQSGHLSGSLLHQNSWSLKETLSIVPQETIPLDGWYSLLGLQVLEVKVADDILQTWAFLNQH